MRAMKRGAVFLYLLAALFALPAAAQTPRIAAESYILMDAETGTVLAEENANLRLPPASLTKIMSTYLYFRAVRDGLLPLSQPVLISENAWGSRVAGSKMFIEVNTQVRVEDLLRGVIVQSGNDAAIALAEAISGDEALFAAEMNRTAAAFGMANSKFQNATGLPAKAHYSSARDIAEISRRTARDFPELYAMYKEREFTYNNIRQENRNGLLDSFAGADGVKTGYTKAAGFCLAASAVRGGRRLVAVVMKAKSGARARAGGDQTPHLRLQHLPQCAVFRRRGCAPVAGVGRHGGGGARAAGEGRRLHRPAQRARGVGIRARRPAACADRKGAGARHPARADRRCGA